MDFGKKNSGDIKDMEDLQAVKNSITNILTTQQGQRRMLPTFNIGLHNYLFDPIDETTAYEIGENIFEAIQTWDSRVIVDDIQIKPNYDQNRYDVSLTFRIQGPQEQETITTILHAI